MISNINIQHRSLWKNMYASRHEKSDVIAYNVWGAREEWNSLICVSRRKETKGSVSVGWKLSDKPIRKYADQ